ncbi:hypothetical protein ACHQM5_026671 [Ranunculus cassubicifolius]
MGEETQQNMHIAEKGEGPVILFLHGFPQLWYSWRHQILSLSAQGYKAVAPDLRGCGDTDAPPSSDSYTTFSIVSDLVALLDVLGQEQVFVVGHDWGAIIAWNLCLFRPDRVKALVNLSIPFQPRNPARIPVTALRALFGEDHYIVRFQEPGDIEAENWELTGAWTGAKVNVPAKYIAGDLDLMYNFPGTKEFINGGGFKSFVPLLDDVVIMEGVGHFIQEEKPDEISTYIYDFIKQFS